MSWPNYVRASLKEAREQLEIAEREINTRQAHIDAGELASALFRIAQYANEAAAYVAAECFPVEVKKDVPVTDHRTSDIVSQPRRDQIAMYAARLTPEQIIRATIEDGRTYGNVETTDAKVGHMLRKLGLEPDTEKK